MNKTKTRLLANLICAVLVMADIMPVGLVAQAAEMPQQTFIEMENVEELESSEDMIDKRVEESELLEDMTDKEFEESYPTDDRIDTENIKVGEAESETSKEVNPDEEAETPDISLPIEDEDVKIEGPKTAEVLAVTGDIIAEGTYTENGSNTAWVIDVDGNLTVTGSGEIKGYNEVSMPWHDFRRQIKTAVINVSGTKNVSYLFYNCENLISVDFSGFETSNITDMQYMFYGCNSLTELKISGFDTRNVTNMKYMFFNCTNLIKLDVSDFVTTNVTDMELMFYECSNLSELDVSGFDTANVKNMHGMFRGCSSLQDLDISGFVTANVIDMGWMFYECSNLQELDVSGFDAANVTDMSGMFGHCSSLTELDLSGFNTAKVTDMLSMFAGCSSLTELDVSSFNTAKVTDMNGMFDSCSSITELDLRNFDTTSVTDMSMMFMYCNNLTRLNLKGWNNTNVTTMRGMFSDCNNLTKLDLSSFGTVKVTDMGSMFFNCSRLTELNLISFDTGNVTNMGDMFFGCNNLMKLDLSHFDTSNVTDMSEMFDYCNSIMELNLSNFVTSNVTDIDYMFEYCSSITKLDLSSFDIGNVTNLEGMFAECNSLTELDLSSFNTANVTNMEFMFFGCDNLEKLDISGFDVSNVTNMMFMFDRCRSLIELDLSNFDTTNANMSYLLENCDSLQTICTPLNVTHSVDLPKNDYNDVWYRNDTGETLTQLPKGLSYSILLTRNKRATAEPHIVARKSKTVYQCGETVEVDDLSVSYYGSDGTVKKLQSTDYTTNVAQINQTMSVPGTKTLTVTYQNNGSTLTAEITLIVACLLDETNTTVTLPNSNSYDYVYNGEPKTPTPTVIYNSTGNIGNDTSVILEEGKDYTVIYRNNTDAYEGNTEGATDAPTVIVKGIGAYSGTFTRTFRIVKAAAPADMEFKVYVSQCQTAHPGQTFDIALVFANYGKITGYEITNVIEKPTNSGTVFSKIPETADINANGILTYNTNAGAENDSADITVKVSFANYQDTTLTVTFILITKEIAVISGISMPDSVYTGSQVFYIGTATATKEDGTDITGQVELVYRYSGTQANGDAYIDTYEAPINAGSYVLTVAVSDDDINYVGSEKYPFTINKASVTITAKDTTLSLADIEDSLPLTYEYEIKGLLNEDELIKEPTFTYTDIKGNLIDADSIDRTQSGTYYILPNSADAGMNYEISYQKGILTIGKKQDTPEESSTIFMVTFDLMGHNIYVPSIADIETGSLIDAPEYLLEGERVTEGNDTYIFAGWYKDKTFALKQKWNFANDTVQNNITLYACWLTAAADANANGSDLSVQEIPDQTYTGNAIKPSVIVYSGDGTTLLKAGKDYSIKYYNNKDADTEAEKTKGGTGSSENDGTAGFTKDMAYIVITGKGNYQGTIYRNFHILPQSISSEDKDGNVIPAPGFSMKYTDQLIINAAKEQKPLSSLKYKKAMEAGTDYEVKLTALMAYSEQGNSLMEGSLIGESGVGTLPAIPQGYYGSFLMTVSGKGNYSGSFTKTIIVTDKSHLMKYVSISLGKNIKTRKYTGEDITLTPAYYDSVTKKYYAIDINGTENMGAELDGKDVFTVKSGNEYLRYGKDFSIRYTNNKAVGTATMTIVGMGEYMGSKSVTFKIVGTAFNTNNILINSDNFVRAMSYTGKALTQNKVILTTKAINDIPSQTLVYGTHYTISYKNNLKKGTATMIFTAKPESGYSGSFKKTFKITAQRLLDVKFDENHVTIISEDTAKNIKVMKWSDEERAVYSKNGATLAFTLRNSEGIELKKGVDYTVNYKNNKAVTSNNTTNLPTMTIKGKGNYAGTLIVNFQIKELDIGTAITDKSLTVSVAPIVKKDNMKFIDFKFKILDGKQALSEGETKDYTLDLSNCTDDMIQAYAEALENDGIETTVSKPTVKIKGVGNYMGEKELSLEEYIYVTKLTSKNLKIEIIGDSTYTGYNVEPDIRVTYYPNNDSGKEGAVVDSTFTKSNYQVTYGSNNIKAGKKKGSVTITGTGLFGGSVTVKFDIVKKGIYK